VCVCVCVHGWRGNKARSGSKAGRGGALFLSPSHPFMSSSPLSLPQMSIILFNLAIGPPLFRLALIAVGETREQRLHTHHTHSSRGTSHGGAGIEAGGGPGNGMASSVSTVAPQLKAGGGTGGDMVMSVRRKDSWDGREGGQA
jgi:hypothetical protein